MTWPNTQVPKAFTFETAKVEDPFADLDSLETEMARLLGREKLS